MDEVEGEVAQEVVYAQRQGPPDTTVTWNDSTGTHEVTLGADGLFTPTSQSEDEFATMQGWPSVEGDQAAPEQPTVATKPAKATPAPSTPPTDQPASAENQE